MGWLRQSRLPKVVPTSIKAMRIMANLQYRELCRNVFREMDILMLAILLIFETVVFCKIKCMPLQGARVHDYPTFGRDLYWLFQNRSRAAMNLPSQTGVRFLNNLPEDIRLEGNLGKSRYRLKRFLILEEFYDVGEE
jgi:hypothetical protein